MRHNIILQLVYTFDNDQIRRITHSLKSNHFFMADVFKAPSVSSLEICNVLLLATSVLCVECSISLHLRQRPVPSLSLIAHSLLGNIIMVASGLHCRPAVQTASHLHPPQSLSTEGWYT